MPLAVGLGVVPDENAGPCPMNTNRLPRLIEWLEPSAVNEPSISTNGGFPRVTDALPAIAMYGPEAVAF